MCVYVRSGAAFLTAPISKILRFFSVAKSWLNKVIHIQDILHHKRLNNNILVTHFIMRKKVYTHVQIIHTRLKLFMNVFKPNEDILCMIPTVIPCTTVL